MSLPSVSSPLRTSLNTLAVRRNSEVATRMSRTSTHFYIALTVHLHFILTPSSVCELFSSSLRTSVDASMLRLVSTPLLHHVISRPRHVRHYVCVPSLVLCLVLRVPPRPCYENCLNASPRLIFRYNTPVNMVYLGSPFLVLNVVKPHLQYLRLVPFKPLEPLRSCKPPSL